jgi:serine protease
MGAKKVFFARCISVLLTVLMTVAAVSDSLAAVYGGKNGLTAKMEAMPLNQIIVKYKTSANLATTAAVRSVEQMQRMNNVAGVSLGYLRPMSGEAHVLRLPQRMEINRVLDICARLATMSEVEYAEPDYIMHAAGNSVEGALVTPNDPLYPNQWHYFAPGSDHYGVNAPAAWDITTGSAGIYAAVIDTGILNHADLSGRWVGGYDFITDVTQANDGDGRDANPLDPGDWVAASECGPGLSSQNSTWHGTHVSGTIGAASNNGDGVTGLNWVSQVVPLRALGKCGGTVSDVADAMRWAAGLPVSGVPANPNPAKVANMSLGASSPTCPATYQNAVKDVVAAGTVLVVSAGNDNHDASLHTPANCSGVITVAATNRSGGRAYYSNYGSEVEIAAPGGAQSGLSANDPNGVLSTLNTGATTQGSDSYIYYQGTSMAAPHVTGIVSLMFSVNPALTPAQVTNILQATATPFPTGTGSDCTTSTCGGGIVNAYEAVAMAQAVNGPPFVLATVPASGATGVSLASAIKVVFSKPMNPSTITTGTFTLKNGVTGSVSYDPATYTATFTTDPPGLEQSITYTATITTGAADAGGTHMTAAKSWSFTMKGPAVLVNGDFENGVTGWYRGYSEISSNGEHSHGGVGYAKLGIWITSVLTQDVTIPANATAATVRFWYDITSSDTTTTANDILTLGVYNPTTGALLQTLATLSNLDVTNGAYAQSSQYDLIAHKGQTINLAFISTDNTDSWPTYFYLDDVELPVTAPAQQNLSVAISGNGAVNSNPAGIACTTGSLGTCAHQFTKYSTVTLMPSASGGSMLGSWTGGCTSLDRDNCLVEMPADKSLTATFTASTVVRIPGVSGYGSLQSAYDLALPSSTIQAQAVELPASPFTLDKGKTILLEGGYDSGYSVNSGYTTMKGILTLVNGSLTVKNLIIK